MYSAKVQNPGSPFDLGKAGAPQHLFIEAPIYTDPSLEMGRLGLRELKPWTQGLGAGRWHRWNMNPGIRFQHLWSFLKEQVCSDINFILWFLLSVVCLVTLVETHGAGTLSSSISCHSTIFSGRWLRPWVVGGLVFYYLLRDWAMLEPRL